MKPLSSLTLLAALSVCVAASSLHAQEKEHRRSDRGKGSAKAPSLIYKLFPDYDIYGYSFESYEERRSEDIADANAILYDLTADERDRVKSLVQKFDEAPTSKEKKDPRLEKLAELINRRAEIAQSLKGRFDVDKVNHPEVQKVLNSSGLMKTQAEIIEIERQRNETINKIRPTIEAMIGPGRTQEAYTQWRHRMEQATEKISIKSLATSIREPAEVRQYQAANPATPRKPEPMRPVKEPTPDETKSARGERNLKAKSSGSMKPTRMPGDGARPQPTKPEQKKSEPPKKEKGPKAKERVREEPPPVPLDAWEQYVKDFLEKYHCTPEQSHAALSILSDLKGRAEQYDKANAKRLEAAESIKDRRKKAKRIAEINAPIDRLFDQLRRRLDGLLTTHQRAIKKAEEAKSQKRKSRRRK